MFAGDALPGIRVDIAPPQAAEALPRMDVAVFAGFAERGPCHVAIAISSVAAYEAVFGGDCPLAWDERGGRMLTGNLAPAVRAFFSNGGTRCWAIRLAETDEFADARVGETGKPDPGSRPGSYGTFIMRGILRRLPTADDSNTFFSGAMLGAASMGSWSDAMQLAARVSRIPLTISGQAAVKHGLRFADQGVLAPGDLVEITGGNGLVTRYAKVLRIEGGEVFALWVSSLARLADPDDPNNPNVRTGHSRLAGTLGAHPAKLTDGTIATLETSGYLVPKTRGQWIHFFRPNDEIWIRIDSIAGKVVRGPAWKQVASVLPAAPLTAARVTIDVAEHRPRAHRVHAGLSPAFEGANAIQRVADADLFHADPANRTAAIRPGFAVLRSEAELIVNAYGKASFAEMAARFGTPAFTDDDRIALRSAWLPIGLEPGFGTAYGPMAHWDEAIVRDGLSRFDERLFLDPRLANLHGAPLAERVAAIRDYDEQPLFGIHAAFDIAGDLFPEPSLLAVPDAAQPGWQQGIAADSVPLPRPGAPALANWRNHADGCPPEKTLPLTEPDFSGFLDCSTQLLEAPVFDPIENPVAADEFLLSWSTAPAGSEYILEEASQPDFTDAAELLREEQVTELRITGRGQGAHYYRLHIALDGNVSPYAAIVVVLRKARYAATPASPSQLSALHAAMLRMASANGDFFAILSLPSQYRTVEAASHARALATLAPGAGGAARLGADEGGSLSYGALYHPWLAARTNTGLVASPPDGAVAGLMAARARTRGAWIAPANDPLRDVVGLDPSLPDAELLTLDRARVNMVRHLPIGFALHDADTLAPAAEWRPINVRRLMMLLRRTLIRRGNTHVFEPNGPALRRAVERSLTATLDDLQARGAFAGATSEKSFRVAVQQQAGDLDNGRLIVEIAVAPSQPIRFLTLRLVQQGARLTILEEA